MPKARHADEVRDFTDIPNIGKAMAEDFAILGMRKPAELAGRDPYALYDALCKKIGVRQDPCVLDTFIAAVRFMEGGPSLPWWHFTDERKRHFGQAR